MSTFWYYKILFKIVSSFYSEQIQEEILDDTVNYSTKQQGSTFYLLSIQSKFYSYFTTECFTPASLTKACFVNLMSHYPES